MKLPDLVATGTRAVVNGVWLGLLSPADVDALDERYYDQQPVYRSAAWNERGLFDWERAVVDQHLGGCHRVVVLATGGGRETLALLQLGFDAYGYEPHPLLADHGAALLADHGHPGRVRRSGRGELPEDAPPCDAVVIGWGAYGLIAGRDRRIRLLDDIRRRLPADGRVLLSCLVRTTGDREARWTHAIATTLRRAGRRPPTEPGDTLAPNKLHVFVREELLAEVAEAGLAVVSDVTVAIPDRTTTYACVVATPR